MCSGDSQMQYSTAWPLVPSRNDEGKTEIDWDTHSVIPLQPFEMTRLVRNMARRCAVATVLESTWKSNRLFEEMF